MKTKVHLYEHILVAVLEDGHQLLDVDAVKLADRLWAENVTADEVSLVDWHEDPDKAPLSGQKIAIHFRLRSLAKINEGY